MIFKTRSKNGAAGIANISEDQLVALISKTLAHELGHGLGLPHTAYPKQLSYQSAQQKIEVLAGSTSFELAYAGSPPQTLPANAAPSQVKNALLSLVGVERADFSVTGSIGGPYFVDFDVSSPNVLSLFKGSRVPLLTGLNTAVSEIRPGRTDVTFANEVVIGPAHGRDDVMRGTVSLDDLAFLPSISLPVLQMGLGTGWSNDLTRNVTSFYEQALRVQKLHVKQSNILPAGFTEDLPEADSEGVEFEGPAIAMFAPDGSLADQQPLDFGKVQPGAPVTQTLSLVNLGGVPVVLRSIGVTQGFDRFSVPQIPVTTLQPGESLQIPVTFNSVLNLKSSGLLVVDSDIGVIGGTVDLVGTGEFTNTPAIKLDFYNNLGPVRVGEITGFHAAGSESHGKLTNVGSAPLIISQFRVAAGQGFGEWTTASLTQPITLAPGETTGIPFAFRPSKAGLRPGTIEVLSNDPRTPLLRVPIVATGVITNDDFFTYEGADLGNDYVAVGDMLSYQTNLPDLRTKSDDTGNWEFFLPADAGVRVSTFDDVSGLIAYSAGFTNASGVTTFFRRGNFLPSIFADTDGDGLPDDVEFAIGTNPNKIDTDSDGTNDFAELDTGLNPLDDRPAANGIVSALPTGSTALDIKLTADFLDPSRSLAYVASGSSGLTIVDVTDFARPIAVSQLGAPGVINNVSLDVVRKLVAAASPSNGVHLIDVTIPARPTLLRTLPHEGTDPVAAVELYDGLVYVGVGGKIRAFDVQSGELSSDFALGTQRVLGMSRSGDRLYATLLDTASNQRLLRIFEISTAGLAAGGSMVLPDITAAGDPYIADGVAWIPAGDRVVTVNVSAPLSPQLIAGTATIGQGGAADIELNGSGLAVVAGFVNPAGSAIVLQSPNANTVNQIFTRFTLPSFGQAVALSSGLAYIADGVSGLQLVNFLQRDTGNVPPTVSLNAIAGDLNPAQAGVQLYEGSSVTIGHRISDDVQVRKVELLVDGTVVRTELSYPYDLTTVLPTIAQTGNQAVLQVRATDTGGNSTLSDPLVIDVLADVTGPTISTLDPASGSTQPISRRKLSITFSEALDRATIVPASFVLQGPSGLVNPISLDLRQRDTQVEILYPPLAQGAYTFVTHAALVKDRAGNALGAADISSTFTLAAAVFVPTIRWVNDAGGDWGNANNWRDVTTSAPRLPTATDNVLIDVPTDALISISSGVYTVNSLVSNERFQIAGGIVNNNPVVSPRLNVSTTIQVNNTFLLSGNYAPNPATFSGTLLRGSGGQGLTIGGFSRLDAATIQTDVAVNQVATELWIANGLALEGTLTVTAHVVKIFAEGTQTWSSGTFVSTGATVAEALVTIGSVGTSTLTLGENVTFQAQVVFATGVGPAPTPGTAPIPHKLSLINRGTLKAKTSTPTLRFGVFTRTESFTNFGVVSAQDYGTVSIEDKSFTNAATGWITLSNGVFPNFSTGAFGKDNTTSFANAGTIELVNSRAAMMSRINNVNQVWSNTGTIIVDKSILDIYGSFTSDDLVNVHNTGDVYILGLMDNTGRTFTFNTQTKSFTLSAGRIKGGTLVMAGPTTRLEFTDSSSLGVIGTLDGVTLQGDVAVGGKYTDFLSGNQFSRRSVVQVENGLTLNGTLTIYSGSNQLRFKGAQNVSGGTIQFLPLGGSFVELYIGIQADNGPVVFDSTVTIRSGGGGGNTIYGNIINNAPIVIDADSNLSLSGFQSSTAPAPFINRGTITVPASRTLNVTNPFTNEGQIVVSGGTLNINANTLGGALLKNTGVINQTSGFLAFRGSDGTNPRKAKTADLGNFDVTGGTVLFRDGIELDNSNATLVIGSTSQWYLEQGSTINGGTIQVAPTATLAIGGNFPAPVLKDVIVNGNMSGGFAPLALVGDLDFNGNVADVRSLQFGHDSLYAGIPLVIRGGSFTFAVSGTPGTAVPITGTTKVPNVTLEADVILKGNRVDATFTQPLTNRGQIIADSAFGVTNLFHTTAAPITNEGTLSAINRGLLRIANLAAPNSGIVSAAAGSSVEFTSTFAQASTGTTQIAIGGTAATQFGLVAVTGAATLAGTLDVQFASGYTPAVGNSFKVLTYASKTGTFATVKVTGLASGLTVTPQYNGTDLTLVVGAAAGGEGESNSLPIQDSAIGAALEQLFSPPSKKLAPSAATHSAYPIDQLNAFPTAVILKTSSGVAQVSLSEYQPSSKLRHGQDISDAIDEVFASIGNELLLTKT